VTSIACKAEITRTITTLKTRLLLTENKCTTAPIIENNNDEMSARIQVSLSSPSFFFLAHLTQRAM
jgi:hypothetical protein